MINIEIATYRSQLDIQIDDVRKLFITNFILVFLTIVSAIWGPVWLTILFALTTGLLTISLANHCKRMTHNLYELTRNVRTRQLDLI